ncbi:MAG: hypothetical protein LUE27_11205, partial [Clostridia bacterium]|nr:hypothetical protein [Clostridia bacterium]
IEEFYSGLAELHIGEWKEIYRDSSLCDESGFSLRIEYSNDKRSVEYGGINAYPYNFDALERLLGLGRE